MRSLKYLLLILLGLTLGSAVTWWATLHGVNAPLQWPWRPITLSLAMASGAVLLLLLLQGLLAGLHTGRFGWQQRLRAKLGLEPNERMHEAMWLTGLLHLIVWVTLPLLILDFWGMDELALKLLKQLASKGFKLGSVTIVPGKLLIGVLLFVALFSATRWLQNRLENKWLMGLKTHRGTREAVATLFGYVAFMVAALLAMSVSGFNFTNLAIVAGALSVGIGFGLQNIVNNFVSGLILLFEQPVRTGDIVSVGETLGTVRRIRIRSTEIETFERFSVTVPNSDIISTHVQNWSLRDSFMRLSIPVRVAHGSDTEKVRALLLQVAKENPQVVPAGGFLIPGPEVLFVLIGENSLDFQLRCYISDLGEKLRVTSQLNFAIDRVFRENGIRCPFPQRDVWLRQAPADNEIAPPSTPATTPSPSAEEKAGAALQPSVPG